MPDKKNAPEIRFKDFLEPWKKSKLGNIYSFKYGEYNNNPSNGGIYPVFGANGIIGGFDKFNAENSVIIGHMGEYAGSVLWGEGKHFVTYNGTISLPNQKVINDKFGYFMLFQLNLAQICGGSGMPFLSYEQLQRFDCTFPQDKKEQQKIGKFFSKIDDLIKFQQQKLEKLKNIKKSMLDKMFPKNGNTIPEIRFKDFLEPWKKSKLGNIYSFKYGEYNNNPSNGGIYPVFGANGIIGGFDKFNAENSVIIGHMGEYAGSVLWGEGKHFVTYNGTISLPNQKVINDKFGYFMLFQLNLAQICGGSGMPFLSYEQLQRFDCTFPQDKKEQQKIGKFFSKIDDLIKFQQQKLEKLKNIKKSMLDKMFV